MTKKKGRQVKPNTRSNSKLLNGSSSNNNKKSASYSELSDDNNDNPPSKGFAKKMTFGRFQRKGSKNPKSCKQDNNHNLVASNHDDVTFRKALERDGTRSVVDMASDGNCLFRSLADQLYVDHGYHHDQVREKVCDFMEQHQDEFSGFLVLDETESDHDAQDFESYIAAMREDGEWGGNLELVAAARCYCRNITVFSAPLAAFTIECGEGVKTTGPDLQLSYHDNDHYNSVRPFHGIATKHQPSNGQNGKNNTVEPPTMVASKKQAERKKTASISTKSSVSHSEEEGDAVEVELQEAVNLRDDDDDDHTLDANTPSSNSGVATATTHDTISPSPLTNEPDNNNVNDIVLSERAPVVAPKKNGVCPCGSGLRYKKCCWAKEKHRTRLKKLRGDGLEDVVEHTDSRPCLDNDDDKSGTSDQDIPTINGHFRVLKI